MNHSELIELIKKYSQGNCTEAEKSLLESWYIRFELNDVSPLTDVQIEEINSSMPIVIGKKSKVMLWSRIVAAASIVICIGVGYHFYQKDHNTPTEITAKNDIAPGGNRAFLTLADGKRIVLTDAKNGELAEQSGVKITKAADGQLVYTVSNISNENYKINAYNTIETPRGGTYQVRLPDGTKVWLNAASTLRFPSSFARLVNRRVELLSGEAYFEVAKDKKHPFIVKTDQQEVEVLGTHFNINSYRDELSTKTTLLEGSVFIKSSSKSIRLIPGEQIYTENSNLIKRKVNTDDVVAWKDGEFAFNNEKLHVILNQIARWYDLDIVYLEKSIQNKVFWGSISRFKNVSDVLKILELTNNVHFKIEGRRIIVTK